MKTHKSEMSFLVAGVVTLSGVAGVVTRAAGLLCLLLWGLNTSPSEAATHIIGLTFLYLCFSFFVNACRVGLGLLSVSFCYFGWRLISD